MVIFHSYVAVYRRVNGANGLAVDSKATEIEWGWGHLDPSGMPKTLWFASQLSQWKLRSAWQAKLKNHPHWKSDFVTKTLVNHEKVHESVIPLMFVGTKPPLSKRFRSGVVLSLAALHQSSFTLLCSVFICSSNSNCTAAGHWWPFSHALMALP